MSYRLTRSKKQKLLIELSAALTIAQGTDDSIIWAAYTDRLHDAVLQLRLIRTVDSDPVKQEKRIHIKMLELHEEVKAYCRGES